MTLLADAPRVKVPKFLKPYLHGRSMRSLSWSFLRHYMEWEIPGVEPSYSPPRTAKRRAKLCSPFFDHKFGKYSAKLDQTIYSATYRARNFNDLGRYDHKHESLIYPTQIPLGLLLKLPEPTVSNNAVAKIKARFGPSVIRGMSLQIAYPCDYGNIYVTGNNALYDNPNDGIWFIRLVNGTPEANGLRRVFWRRVPSVIHGSVVNTLAWMHTGTYGNILPMVRNRT